MTAVFFTTVERVTENITVMWKSPRVLCSAVVYVLDFLHRAQGKKADKESTNFVYMMWEFMTLDCELTGDLLTLAGH